MNMPPSYVLIFLLCLLIGQQNANLVEITEENWEKLLSKDEWMVEFFAPWCPACNRFEPVWKEFSQQSERLGIKVGAADVNASPVLSGLFSVTSLPTVYHIKDGQYRVYNGNRDLDNLVEFIRNNDWKKIEPSSSWLTPNSFLIKLLSLLFKITLYFKDVYSHLTDKYGLPAWSVLTIFVIVTILLGLLLGVLLILLIDCVCPPKRYTNDEIKEISEDAVDDIDKKESKETNEPTEEAEKPRKRKPKKDD